MFRLIYVGFLVMYMYTQEYQFYDLNFCFLVIWYALSIIKHLPKLKPAKTLFSLLLKIINVYFIVEVGIYPRSFLNVGIYKFIDEILHLICII